MIQLLGIIFIAFMAASTAGFWTLVTLTLLRNNTLNDKII